MHTEAPSPSSSSTFRRQYRGSHCTLPIDPFTLSLRQLAVEHRHDAAYTTPSSPCPFKPQTGRTMDDLSRHPQHLLPSINRALPRLNPSHHPVLLPSLLLLDSLASSIIAGVAPI
jgi:hypothetical protein